MTIIVLDGPEAAGKTTLARELERLGARYVHWGLLGPSRTADTRYLDPLIDATTSPPSDVTVWDRSWLSGSVYGPHQGRTDRLTTNPWTGEWLYGRAAAAAGLRILVRGSSPSRLAERRRARADPTDIPIDPALEQQRFEDFARDAGWLILGDCELESIPRLAGHLYQEAINRTISSPLPPPGYAGPHDASVLVVGEARGGPHESVPGAWLPFTSRYTTNLAATLGSWAFWVGWTNVADFPASSYARFDRVVACGGAVIRAVQKEVQGCKTKVVGIPHPSWLYRWGRARTSIELVEREFRKAVLSHGEGS